MTGWEGFEDDIAKLQYLACNGSKSAAEYLTEYYSDGPAKDEDLELKYASYAAIAGDIDPYRRIAGRCQCFVRFYPEDIILSGPFEDMDGRRYHGYMAVQDNGNSPWPFTEDQPFIAYAVGNEDLVNGLYPLIDYDTNEALHPWPFGQDMVAWVDRHAHPDDIGPAGLRFQDDLYLYFGIGVERNEDAAMRDLLAMALDGDLSAAQMISFAIGYEPNAFAIKVPDRTPEQDHHRSECE